MEPWSTHNLHSEASQSLGQEEAFDLRSYAQKLISKRLPVIFSLGHLANITGVSRHMLQTTVSRRRESANYRMYAVAKRSGGRRFIHSVCGDLMRVQQFINLEVLQRTRPHPASFAFHASGGIRRCAAMHCGAKWLFQFDLSDFFYSVTEVDVYRIFLGLGYWKLLAFELARLCTTTRLPFGNRAHLHRKASFAPWWNWKIPRESPDGNSVPYNERPELLGALPQGAPTSPMLSNLAAHELDVALEQFSFEHGFVYTRYADDITVSAGVSVSRSSIRQIQRNVIDRIRKSGFRENPKKTHVSGPGSKKLVLGLLVDGQEPRLSKEAYRRIDRHLHASAKYGLVATAAHEEFDSAFGFYNHLSGLIAFVKDVDLPRWQEFSALLKKVEVPWA